MLFFQVISKFFKVFVVQFKNQRSNVTAIVTFVFASYETYFEIYIFGTALGANSMYHG